jgi:hypothetical protein
MAITETWDATRDPFDPVRAGIEVDERGWFHQPLRGFLMATRSLGVRDINIIAGPGIAVTLPADLPHATVLAILRANGYQGGDDE